MRFNINLSWGMRLALSLYPLSRAESSVATLVPIGCDHAIPVFIFFPAVTCRIEPPAVESPHVNASLWLGDVCIDVSTSEAAALQEFITAARAGHQAGA